MSAFARSAVGAGAAEGMRGTRGRADRIAHLTPCCRPSGCLALSSCVSLLKPRKKRSLLLMKLVIALPSGIKHL